MMVDRELTIKLAPRGDGGLRVWSDDIPGLVLSHRDQKQVLKDISPFLVFLLHGPK